MSVRLSTRGKPHTHYAPREKYTSGETMTRVDPHVYVWTPAYAPVATHPLLVIEDSAERQKAGIDDVHINERHIVQPVLLYKFDHAWIDSAIVAHPTRLHVWPRQTRRSAVSDTPLSRLGREVCYLTIRVGAPGDQGEPNFAGLRSATVQAALEACAQDDRPACLLRDPHHFLPTKVAHIAGSTGLGISCISSVSYTRVLYCM